jgi:hypothetical protein
VDVPIIVVKECFLTFFYFLNVFYS